MLPPEGNCGFVVGCCFKTYFAHAISGEPAFHFARKGRTVPDFRYFSRTSMVMM